MHRDFSEVNSKGEVLIVEDTPASLKLSGVTFKMPITTGQRFNPAQAEGALTSR